MMDVIIFFIELSLLLLLLSVGYRKYMLDTFRSNLFSLRNALFDIASDSEGKLPFDSKEYREVERSINSTIRYAELISIFQLMVMYRSLRRGNPLAYQEIVAEEKRSSLIRSKLDKPIVDGLRKIKKTCENTWATQLLISTVPALLFSVFFILGYVVYGLVRKRFGDLRKKGFKAIQTRILVKTEDFFRDEVWVLQRNC